MLALPQIRPENGLLEALRCVAPERLAGRVDRTARSEQVQVAVNIAADRHQNRPVVSQVGPDRGALLPSAAVVLRPDQVRYEVVNAHRRLRDVSTDQRTVAHGHATRSANSAFFLRRATGNPS